MTCFPATTPSDVGQAPKFEVPLNPVTVNEGDKLNLKCHVGGSPPLNIYWMKDRRELKSSGSTRITFVDGVASLEISQASKTDAGDYLCKASNAAGSEFCKSRVTVRGLCTHGTNIVPADQCVYNKNKCMEFIFYKSCFQTKVQSQLHLRQPLQLQWSQSNGSTICTSLRRPRMFLSLRVSPSEPYFTLRNRHSHTTHTDACWVNILLYKMFAFCSEGTATFIAKIGGDPIPSVKWMKGKWRQIVPGGRVSIEHKGQDAKLEIREATKSDAGQYRCVASNKHGEIECSAEMEVTKKEKEEELGDVRIRLKK